MGSFPKELINTGLDVRSFFIQTKSAICSILSHIADSVLRFFFYEIYHIIKFFPLTSGRTFNNSKLFDNCQPFPNTIRDILAQNIQINQTIIDSQKRIWQKIEQSLAAQGTTLEEFLRQKISSPANNVYTEKSLKQEFADINNLADMQQKIQSKLSTQIQETETSYRNVLREISSIVGAYNKTNLPEIIEQLKSLEGSFTSKLEDTYYKRLLTQIQTEGISEKLPYPRIHPFQIFCRKPGCGDL